MKKKNILLQAYAILLLLALSSLVFPCHTEAKESILTYDVIAELQEDSSLLMTERIRVKIEHKTIKHGIYRVFPMSQSLENNKSRFHSYDFETITFDGKPVDYTKAAQAGHIALAIGSEKEKAPLGEHTYEIRYRVTNHILFFEDRDEIYLNVTGNKWKLPIDSASFTVIVPGGVDNILKTDAFTGAYGESGKDFVMEGKNVFRTTRPFAMGEGLTVAVAWKKDLISRPGDFRVDVIHNNREACFLILFGLIILFYFICKRRLKEHIPPVIPLFSPPAGMTPGYVAALKNKSDTGRVFHAELMGAAVNGFLHLDMKDAKNIVIHTHEPRKKPKEWIANYCQDIASWLTKPENPCDLKTLEGKIQASTAHRNLESHYGKLQKDLWQNNLLIKIAGWTTTFILACGMSMAIGYPETTGESKWMYPVSVVICYAFTGIGTFSFRAMRKKNRGILGKAGYLFLGGTLWFLGLGMLLAQMDSDSFLLSRHIFLVCLIAFLMGRLPSPSRTPKAMAPYAQVLGLEMYICTAEKHRLAMINAPEDTIEKYEELLPYAVALNCADAWQKRFDKLLRDLDYTPEWLERDLKKDPDYLGPISTATSSKAMSVAISACISAHIANERSVGSSGFSSDDSSGGSSGGGSGGGGGGGW